MKTTLAAVLAYVVARQLPGEALPILAPLTAVLIVQVTLYSTVRHSVDRVGAVVAGVLIAFVISQELGISWWSLGLVIFCSIAIGRLLRLGPFLMEVPISGMLVLAIGGQSEFALFRVYETLIGAAVGVFVNALLAPPVYVQGAAEALGDLAADIGTLLRRVSDEVANEWSRDSAHAWYVAALGLDRSVRRARDALARGEESLRLNPWPQRRRVEQATPSLAAGLTALEHVAIQVREVLRGLADRVRALPEDSEPGDVARVTMSVLLADLADAVEAFGDLLESPVTGPPREDVALRGALSRAAAHRDEASVAMLVDGRAEPGIWRVHGGLLVNIERLIDELDLERGLRARAVRRREPASTSRR